MIYHYESSAENNAIFSVLSPTRQGGTLACEYVCIYMNICVYILNICVYIWIYVYIYEYICIYSDVSLLQLFMDTSLVQVSFTGLFHRSLLQVSLWFFSLPFFFDFHTSPFWVSFVGLFYRSILWISFDFDTSFACNSFVDLFCRSLL